MNFEDHTGAERLPAAGEPLDGDARTSDSPSDPVPDAIARAAEVLESRADPRVLLTRLAAGLAHEIKNPLSTMSINLALLDEELVKAGEAGGELPAREKRWLKRVVTLQREVKRLETIVDDFLRYARGSEVDRSPHDLGTLVREVLEFVDLEDRRLDIRHHVEIQTGLPLVMLDVGALKQALLNLFVNARQALPGGGELIVRLRRVANFVELSVTDTGVGMSPEALERCFDVYYSTKKGGTGLGLSTTKRIVEEHGGKITVISEVNKGTSFAILLPLLVEIYAGQGRGASPVAPAAAHAAELD